MNGSLKVNINKDTRKVWNLFEVQSKVTFGFFRYPYSDVFRVNFSIKSLCCANVFFVFFNYVFARIYIYWILALKHSYLQIPIQNQQESLYNKAYFITLVSLLLILSKYLHAQLAFTCSKRTVETPKQCKKFWKYQCGHII